MQALALEGHRKLRLREVAFAEVMYTTTMAAPAAAYLRSLWDVSCDDYRRDGAFAEYVSVP